MLVSIRVLAIPCILPVLVGCIEYPAFQIPIADADAKLIRINSVLDQALNNAAGKLLCGLRSLFSIELYDDGVMTISAGAH